MGTTNNSRNADLSFAAHTGSRVVSHAGGRIRGRHGGSARTSVEQNIVDAVEISRLSHIPVLFMSNPGLGKTTILTRYAAHNDMHLETLIGSRFTPEEISGYQVNNGGDHLTHMSPEWFSRIQQKAAQGITTLLFIDELSTCSEFVQGSLLSLIFDRTIGSGKFLPEDCLIVAAANYAGNLPGTMNIMAPTLNRFIVVNLNHNYTALDMMQEFLNPPEQPVYPKLTSPFTEEGRTLFMEKYQNIWREIFLKYSDPESALGVIDISNQQLDGLYSESKGCIYNFISGRSLSYLARGLIAYISLNIHNRDILEKMADGLVGAGSCQFSDEQAVRYRKMLYCHLERLVGVQGFSSGAFQPLVNDIAKDVSSYLMNQQNSAFTHGDSLRQLMELCNEIQESFVLDTVTAQCSSLNGKAKFMAEMEAIFELQAYIAQSAVSRNLFTLVTRYCMDYYGLYCQMAGVRPDYRKFGMADSKFERMCFLRICKNGKASYAKAALLKTYFGSTQVMLYLVPDSEIYRGVTVEKYVNNERIEVLDYDGGFKWLQLKDFLTLEKKSVRNLRITA